MLCVLRLSTPKSSFVPCMRDLGFVVCFCFEAMRVMIGQFEDVWVVLYFQVKVLGTFRIVVQPACRVPRVVAKQDSLTNLQVLHGGLTSVGALVPGDVDDVVLWFLSM